MKFLICLLMITSFIACTRKEEEKVVSSPEPTASSGPSTTLFGKVTLTQSVPEAKEIKMSSDPGCVKANGAKKVTDDRVVVGPDKGLASALVKVVGVKSAKKGSELSPVVLDQLACMYSPHVVGVVVGQELSIKNSDPFLHNVNAAATKNDRFNVGMTGNQEIRKVFKQPEMIKVKCDIHGWMNGYIAVVEHPYFFVTDPSGKFEITDIPGGTYQVEVWHEKFGTKSAQVTLDGTRKELNFDY